jgi:hypothetical protein
MRTGKFYVGSTKDVVKRKREHFRRLRKGNHHCEGLQIAWNMEADKSVFELQMFIFCKKNDLEDLEQLCFDNLKPHYNTNPLAKRPPVFSGKNHPLYGKCGENSALWGKTGETAPNPVLTEAQAIYILNSPASHAEMAKKFNVQPEAIRRIRIGKTWRHLPAASDEMVMLWKLAGKKAQDAAIAKMNSKTKEQRLQAGRKGSKTKALKKLRLHAEAITSSGWPSEDSLFPSQTLCE